MIEGSHWSTEAVQLVVKVFKPLHVDGQLLVLRHDDGCQLGFRIGFLDGALDEVIGLQGVPHGCSSVAMCDVRQLAGPRCLTIYAMAARFFSSQTGSAAV